MNKIKKFFSSPFSLLIIFVVLVVLLFLFKPFSGSKIKGNTISIGDATIRVTLANTATLREQGLSGKYALATDEGMFFVFDSPDTYGFWMKDMHFPIDIIWLDENMKVVSIKANASPKSYPEVFYPNLPARYVLEVTNGYAKAHDIDVGTKARLR